MTRPGKTIIFLFIAGFVLTATVFGSIAYYFLAPTTISSKLNPRGTHRAKLVRYQGIDVNFKLVVDAQTVFYSPDFAPVDDDFREQISWDEAGNTVVLEVAGKRLFAYDAEQKRKLSDAEVLSVEFAPFSQYRYESVPPGDLRR